MSGRRVSFCKGLHIVVLNDTEAVDRGVKMLAPYFWFVTGHGSTGDHLMFRREFASFYTARVPRLRELEKGGFEVEKVDIEVGEVDPIFYDERDQVLDLSMFRTQKVICIYVNRRLAGAYFTRSRVLVATDWTHNGACISTLKKMMPHLSKIFRKRSKLLPKPRFSLMFGADPEFEVIDSSGRVVSASGIIQGGDDPREEIGRDGAGSQVEIRPAPSGDIWKFVKNIREILKRFASQYPNYSLSVQGDTYPLGGHIHLSVWPDGNVLEILDNWIGSVVIDLSGRARGSYKKMSAYEEKPWGFEYRTPPAAIFLKPQVLFAVLKIMKAVLKRYFSHEGVSPVPTEEEIKRLKIEKEWKILNRFIEEYPRMSKDVLKQWRIRAKVEPKVDIVFRDDWAPEVREFVSEVLSGKLSSLAKKLNEKGIYRLVLFGFRKERGEVCNFISSQFERIDFSYSVREGEVAFGLPYGVRMPEMLTEELKQKWLVVVDEIVSNLK